MKLTRVFWFLIILGSSSVAAYGQTPVDPRLIVSDPPGCGSGVTYAGGTASTPLVESYSNPQCFTYTGTSHLNELFFEFTGVPALTEFICQTNIWITCGEVSGSPSGTVEFHFFDSPTAGQGGPCQANDGLFGTCPGFLLPGGFANVTVQPIISQTPEPGSIILFGTGLIGMIVAVKRRFHAQT